jgi:hypothetical protein
MSIVEPTALAEEQRLRIPVSGLDCIVISGRAIFAISIDEGEAGPGLMMGSEEGDHEGAKYDVQMEVGPLWVAVRDVSPIVTAAGFWHFHGGPSGYQIGPCKWDTVGLPPPDADKERIRLLVQVVVRGGPDMRIHRLGYHLIANGRLAPGESI